MTPHDHAGRRERLTRRIEAAGAARMLVTDPRNVRYLTGFTGSNGRVIVDVDAPARLVTDARYTARAAAEAGDVEVVLGDAFELAAAELAGGRLVAEAGHLTWREAEALRAAVGGAGGEVCDGGDLVEALRLVKDAAELERLATACRITTDAMTWLFDEVLAPGVTERHLAALLERRFVDAGADAPAFPSIVAGGENGAVPHHTPSSRPIAAGELVTVDCGARVDGYHADCTRTVAVGAPPARLVEVHDVVARAQDAGRRAVTADATGADVDAAARRVVVDAGYGEAFLHGTGHGVGLAIHEAPAVAHSGADRLVAQSALTVEPGVYLPGVGGVRIEDTLVVAAGGAAQPLTDIPRELLVR